MSTASQTTRLLQLAPQLLNLVALASETAGQPTIARYLTLAGALFQQGVRAYADLVALKDMVQTMVREEREPTADEWNAFKQRSDVAHSVIQSYNIDAE